LKGKLKRELEIAKNMLQDNIGLDMITKDTDLSKEKVERAVVE